MAMVDRGPGGRSWGDLGSRGWIQDRAVLIIIFQISRGLSGSSDRGGTLGSLYLVCEVVGRYLGVLEEPYSTVWSS